VLGLGPLVAAGTPDNALDNVLDAVRRHVSEGELADDLAVLLLERMAVEHPVTALPGGRVSERFTGVRPDESSLSAG
jgi:hypothetical protein